MAQQTINNNELFGSIRTKLNTMFGEIYTSISSFGTSVNTLLTNYNLIQNTVSSLSVTVDNQINVNTTFTSRLNGIDLDIIAIEDDLTVLNNTGIASIGYLGTPFTFTADTTATKVLAFDTLSLNVGSKVSLNTTTDVITINASGIYEIKGNVIIEAPSNETISFQLYRNGSAITPEFSHQGIGAGKPIIVTYIGAFQLNANDTLELYSKSLGTAFTATFNKSNVVIEKLPY